jgi:hypothetical protein
MHPVHCFDSTLDDMLTKKQYLDFHEAAKATSFRMDEAARLKEKCVEITKTLDQMRMAPYTYFDPERPYAFNSIVMRIKLLDSAITQRNKRFRRVRTEAAFGPGLPSWREEVHRTVKALSNDVSFMYAAKPQAYKDAIQLTEDRLQDLCDSCARIMGDELFSSPDNDKVVLDVSLLDADRARRLLKTETMSFLYEELRNMQAALDVIVLGLDVFKATFEEWCDAYVDSHPEDVHLETVETEVSAYTSQEEKKVKTC